MFIPKEPLYKNTDGLQRMAQYSHRPKKMFIQKVQL